MERRVRKMNKALGEALIALLKEKKLNEISVRELTDRAEQRNFIIGDSAGDYSAVYNPVVRFTDSVDGNDTEQNVRLYYQPVYDVVVEHAGPEADGKPGISEATACGKITMCHECFKNVKTGSIKKGDVLGVARIEGIMGAKKIWELIPLCHIT